MGENARDEVQWLLNALPFWELHLWGSCECSEPWLERWTSTKLSPHDTIKNFLKCRCLKCTCIVHLDLIWMSYDKKKGRKSNYKFDSRPPILWKQGSNEVWLERAIHHWKDILKGYNILSSYFQKKNFIWERYERPKFWDNKRPSFGKIKNPVLGIPRKSDIWM